MASEIFGEKRSGSGSVKQGSNNSLAFTSTVTFIVVTDSTSITREEVLLQTPGLPTVGLLYGPYQLVCTSKSCTRSEVNPLYWDVVCEFESNNEDQEQDQNNPSDNPTTWIPIFKVDSFITKEKVITEDRTTPTPQKIANENNIAIKDSIFANDNEPHLREVMMSRSNFQLLRPGMKGGGYASKYTSKAGNTTDYDII